ncbi:MAG: hypothetical protein GVY13_16720 [Alphaproteobacteria bacterium]|nr:hypothetical protein [Alphaproteobacteria bacterium]
MSDRSCSEATPEERREHKRLPVFWTGKLVQNNGHAAEVSVNLMDISAGGARVTMAEPLQGRPRVKLTIDRVGEFFGEVVWEKLGDLGIRFIDPAGSGQSATSGEAD